MVCPRWHEGGTAGGAETLMQALALRLAARGFDVHYLTTCARDHFTWANELPAGETRVEGLTLHRFPVNPDRNIPAFRRAQRAVSSRNPIRDEDERIWLEHDVNSRELLHHLDTTEYERILAGPYLFGLICHVALRFPERTLLVPCLHDEPFARLKTVAQCFRAVRGCLFNAAPEQALAEQLFGPEGARGVVVGMGMKPIEVDAGAFVSRQPWSAPYLAYCGRRELMKGTPILFDFLEAYRARRKCDLRLVLTGSGVIHPPVELEDAVIDLGFVSEQEKHEVMAGAVAFVHPSVYESFGIVLLEAFMAGTPALVHGGSAVLVDQCRRSGAGLWFRTYPEFELELDFLLADSDRRASMGRAGQRYVQEQFSWPAVEARLLVALEQ